MARHAPHPAPPAAPLTPRARQVIWMLLWSGLLVAALFFRDVARPFLLGALLAYLLDPAVERLASYRIRKWPIPRGAAVLALLGVGAALVGLLASLTLPHLYRELAHLSARARDFAATLTPERLAQLGAELRAWLAARGLPVGELDPQGSLRGVAASLATALRAPLLELIEGGPAVIGGVFSGVFDALLVVMITVFLLLDRAPIFAFARGLVPPDYRGSYDALLARVDRGLAGVVRGQLTICAINGALTFLGLWIFGVPFAYALALLATVCAFIPIFGTFLSSVPIVLAGLAQGLHVAVVMLLWIFGVHALEAYVLNPKVMGDASRLHPLLILFSLLAGERYFGLTGAIFAVPAASIAASLFQHLYAQLGVSE